MQICVLYKELKPKTCQEVHICLVLYLSESTSVFYAFYLSFFFFFTLLSIYQMASTYSYFVSFILILTCIFNIKGAKTCQGEDNQYLCMFYFMCLWIYYDNHNVIIHKRKSCTSLTRFSQWVSPRPWAKEKDPLY